MDDDEHLQVFLQSVSGEGRESRSVFFCCYSATCWTPVKPPLHQHPTQMRLFAKQFRLLSLIRPESLILKFQASMLVLKKGTHGSHVPCLYDPMTTRTSFFAWRWRYGAPRIFAFYKTFHWSWPAILLISEYVKGVKMRCKGVKIILVYTVKIIGLSPLHKTDSLEPSFRRAQPHLQFGLGSGYT